MNDQAEKEPVEAVGEEEATPVKATKASKKDHIWVPDKFSGMNRTGTKREFSKSSVAKKKRKKKK